jgi:hypothetical protein
MLNGMLVYVFDCRAKDIDDTAAYTFLKEVPERYRAYSAGGGKMWVEPVSGVVVQFEDAGKSYFGVPTSGVSATGKPVADFYFWTARYTAETRKAKMQMAIASRRRIQILEMGLPLGLVLGGLAWAILTLRTNTRRATSALSDDASPSGRRL